MATGIWLSCILPYTLLSHWYQVARTKFPVSSLSHFSLPHYVSMCFEFLKEVTIINDSMLLSCTNNWFRTSDVADLHEIMDMGENTIHVRQDIYDKILLLKWVTFAPLPSHSFSTYWQLAIIRCCHRVAGSRGYGDANWGIGTSTVADPWVTHHQHCQQLPNNNFGCAFTN